MKVRQVYLYLRLPDEFRDTWLDGGGDVAALEKLCQHDVSEIIEPLRKAGLFQFVDGDLADFMASLRYALELADWCGRHGRLKAVNAYIHAVAEMRLAPEVLDHLPCQVQEDGCSVQSVVSPTRWQTVLQDGYHRTSDPAGLLAVLDSHIRGALREAAVDITTVLGPEVAEMQQLVADAQPARLR